MLNELIVEMTKDAPISRDVLIDRVEKARRWAENQAEQWKNPSFRPARGKDARSIAQQLGRLLYFLRFGKAAPNSTADEVATYEIVRELLA